MQVKKSSFLYYFAKYLFRIILIIVYRCHIEDEDNVPSEGGVLIAPNHLSVCDPPLMGSMMKRDLHFMAKEELFSVPILGFLIKRTNAFPVKRGKQDMSAMRNAFSLLENGNILLMFPEGTRSKDGNLGKARAGVGMVACHAQVPIIPVKIENTNNIFKFKKIKIKFAKPIYPPKEFSKSDYLSLSQQTLNTIASMSFEK